MAKILHVDPLPVSRMHVARVLMEAGYEIFSTDDPTKDCPGVQFDLEIWANAYLLKAAHRQTEPGRKILLFSNSWKDRMYAEKNGLPFLSKFSEGVVLAQTATRLLGS